MIFVYLIIYFVLQTVFCHIALTKYKLTDKVLKVSAIYGAACTAFYFFPWQVSGESQYELLEYLEFVPCVGLMMFFAKKLGYDDVLTVLIPGSVYLGASIFYALLVALI